MQFIKINEDEIN